MVDDCYQCLKFVIFYFIFGVGLCQRLGFDWVVGNVLERGNGWKMDCKGIEDYGNNKKSEFGRILNPN